MRAAAKVLADSIAYGVRLVTLEVTFARYVLAELNTHRDLSRNSASSRAIPVETRCDQIEADPFVPAAFGKNQRGMQSSEVLGGDAHERAEQIWREAAADAVKHARRLAAIDVHKQYANRVAESYAMHTAIISATELENWSALRLSAAAQPEIQEAAIAIRDALAASNPRKLTEGAWHLPFIDRRDDHAWDSPAVARLGLLIKVSVARCARSSYNRHLDRKPMAEDCAMHDKLRGFGHMSCFEHQAKVVSPAGYLRDAPIFNPPFSPRYDAQEDGTWKVAGFFAGNFRAPFLQYRKTLVGERVYTGT